MSDEEYNKLVALEPKYFKNLSYGIEFSGDGWAPLITYIVECAKAEESRAAYYKALLTSSLIKRERIISEAINLAIEYNSFNFYFTQIKEKFGTLRVYYSSGNQRLDQIISAVEFVSSSTCVRCGIVSSKKKHKYTNMCEECWSATKKANNL